VASVNLEDNSSSDESKEPPHILYTDEFCDEALQTRGILWLTSLPPVESSPVRLSISDDEKQQKLTYVNILWKHTPQQSRLYSQHCTLQTGNNGKATRFVCGREQTIFYKQFKSLHGFHLFGHVLRPAKMKQFGWKLIDSWTCTRNADCDSWYNIPSCIRIMPRPFWQKTRGHTWKNILAHKGKLFVRILFCPETWQGETEKDRFL